MKKSISILLILSIVISTSVFSLADGIGKNKDVVTFKTAYVSSVNSFGTNLNDDIKDDNINTIDDTNMSVKYESNDSLIISGIINGEEVQIIGAPVGRSENGNVVYYSSQCNSDKLSVINFAYEKELEKSNMYFKNYQKKNKSNSILKIYLKNSANDFLILESFNYKPNYNEGFIKNLPINSLLGEWAAKHFEPISSSEEDSVQTRADNKEFYKTISKTFIAFGTPQTHSIRLVFNCVFKNIQVQQTGKQQYEIKVDGKYIRCTEFPNYNSDTESFLHVNKIKLLNTSVPNTAWTSTKIDGSVHSLSGSLSASLGISMGVLGISIDIPSSFTSETTLDINNTYTSYSNGINGQYTRSIETDMDSSFKLTEVGHRFNVDSELTDFGNVVKDFEVLKSRWDIEIINGYNQSKWNYSYDHNVNINIY